MSKLKEIIHQYVVEALEEILSEEAEQISELSVDALEKYKRASKKAIRALHPGLKGSPDSPRQKEIEKRVTGIRQAWQKLSDKSS